MSDRFSCSRAARACGEDLLGTAPPLARWIAVEQPGAWGPDAIDAGRLGEAPARRLVELSRGLDARVVLIRRHGGRRAGDRRVLVADAGADQPWLEQLVVEDLAGLTDLDLEPLGHGASVGGRRLARPRYLVCTHGAHDACCAEHGRPVAAAVDEVAGERTWETSHVGGHRFAGNLVVLPHGVYYGRVTREAAAEVVAAHDAGRLSLEHYRGRVCWPYPVQAAEGFLRRELDEDRMDVVRLAEVPPPEGNVHSVVLAVEGVGRLAVEVAARCPVGERHLSCDADGTAHPEAFELVAVRSLGGAPGAATVAARA